jgi:hypothetical protein
VKLPLLVALQPFPVDEMIAISGFCDHFLSKDGLTTGQRYKEALSFPDVLLFRRLEIISRLLQSFGFGVPLIGPEHGNQHVPVINVMICIDRANNSVCREKDRTRLSLKKRGRHRVEQIKNTRSTA